MFRVKSPKFDPTTTEIEEIEEDMDVPELRGGLVASTKWTVYLRRSFGEILFGTKLNILMPSIPLAMIAVSLKASQVHSRCLAEPSKLFVASQVMLHTLRHHRNDVIMARTKLELW